MAQRLVCSLGNASSIDATNYLAVSTSSSSCMHMVPACGNTRFGFVRRGVQSVFGPVCTSPVSNLRPRAPSCQRQLPAWHRQVASVCSESRCLYSSDAGPSTIYKPSSCTWQYCSLAEVCCIRQVLPFKSGRAATRSHTCLCVINSSKSAGALPLGHVYRLESLYRGGQYTFLCELVL